MCPRISVVWTKNRRGEGGIRTQFWIWTDSVRTALHCKRRTPGAQSGLLKQSE